MSLRSPDDDEYVFWFVVVAAYLLVFNFFWLIRNLLRTVRLVIEAPCAGWEEDVHLSRNVQWLFAGR